MCVNISNILVVVYHRKNHAAFLSLSSLSFDGSILPRSQIAVCVEANGLVCKVVEASDERLALPLPLLLHLFSNLTYSLVMSQHGA